MESKLARLALIADTRRLEPEDRLNAFLEHSSVAIARARTRELVCGRSWTFTCRLRASYDRVELTRIGGSQLGVGISAARQVQMHGSQHRE